MKKKQNKIVHSINKYLKKKQKTNKSNWSNLNKLKPFFMSSNTNYGNIFEQIGNYINDSGKIFFETQSTFGQTSNTNNGVNKNALVFHNFQTNKL